VISGTLAGGETTTVPDEPGAPEARPVPPRPDAGQPRELLLVRELPALHDGIAAVDLRALDPAGVFAVVAVAGPFGNCAHVLGENEALDVLVEPAEGQTAHRLEVVFERRVPTSGRVRFQAGVVHRHGAGRLVRRLTRNQVAQRRPPIAGGIAEPDFQTVGDVVIRVQTREILRVFALGDAIDVVGQAARFRKIPHHDEERDQCEVRPGD